MWIQGNFLCPIPTSPWLKFNHVLDKSTIAFYILHEMPTILFFSLVVETLRKPSKQQIQGIKFQSRASNRGQKLLFFFENCIQHRPSLTNKAAQK